MSAASRGPTLPSNPFGRSDSELDQVLRDLREIEPLLRCSVDVVLSTTQPFPVVVDRVVAVLES